MAGSATTAAARGLGRGHRQASDDELRALVAARVAEMRAQGTTTVEIKGGYGLTVEDEARGCASPPSSPPRRRSSAPTWCRPSTPATARHTSISSRARCWLRRRTLGGWTCSASRTRPTRSPRRRPAPSSWRVSSPDSACGCTATSSVPAGRAARRRAGRRQRRPLHLPLRRRHRGPGRLPAPRWRPSCRGSSSPRARPTPTPGGPRRRRLGRAGHRLQPGTCYSSSMPFVIALAVREMGLTPGEAVYAATAGSAPRCAAATSAGSRSVRGPT